MTSTSLDAELPQRLADLFSLKVRDALSNSNMAEVLARNRCSPAGVCATHDFCDANLLMAEAFAEIVGRESDSASTTDAALWSAAWALAKNAGFPRRLSIAEDPTGRLKHAFVVRGKKIINSRLSQESSEAVDPSLYYGLRPDEIAALDHANVVVVGRPIMDHALNSASQKPAFFGLPIRKSSLTRSGYLLQIFRHERLRADIWNTGGDGSAIRINCAGDTHVLVTEHDDPSVPPPDATIVDVGRYAASGDRVDFQSALDVGHVLEWIEDAHQRGSNPTNVYDYFVAKLGNDPRDRSLIELPLTSPCGLCCVRVIDATSALVCEARAAFGQTHTDEYLVAVARRIVGVYWHG